MSKVITTVTEYEDKALELITRVQDEVLVYVKAAVEFVDERVSDVELPFEVPQLELLDAVPTLSEIVDTQFAFSKKLLANQERFAKNVVKAVKPLTRDAGTATPKATTAKKTAAKKTAA
jgi:hypothetical protein